MFKNGGCAERNCSDMMLHRSIVLKMAEARQKKLLSRWKVARDHSKINSRARALLFGAFARRNNVDVSVAARRFYVGCSFKRPEINCCIA